MGSCPCHRVVINKHYKEIDKIGEGRNGKVYKVIDLDSNYEYALKTFNEEDLIHNHDIIKDNCKKIKHKNIVQYIDSFINENKLNIVLELCHSNLKEYINHQKTIDEEIIFIIIKDICLALKQIYLQKITHDNLKLTNIYISNDMKNIKIGDINLSSLQNIENSNEIATNNDMKELANIIKILLSKQKVNSNDKELEKYRKEINNLIKSLLSKDKDCNLKININEFLKFTKKFITKNKINDNDIDLDEISKNILNKKNNNEIMMTINININEINKEIYLFSKESELNEDNTEIYLNGKKIDFNNFIKNSQKEKVDILLKFNKKLKTCSNMFKRCINIIYIDLSSFDTSEVTDMSNMFSECNGLKNIDLSSLDTQNVNNMNKIFYKCNNLENVDFSFLNLNNIKNMSEMFKDCKNLIKVEISTLDDSSSDTKNIIDMSSMFEQCENLEEVDLSKLNIKNVNNMKLMFKNCKSLKKIDFPSKIKNVNNMKGCFTFCNKLENIDLSSFDFNNVNLSEICKSCSNLKTITFPSSIQKVNNMKGSFTFCENLENIVLSSFEFNKLEDLSEIFQGCLNLKKIKFPSKIKDVNNMKGSFSSCRNLENIDLSSFDFSNVKDLSEMFKGCTNLKEIKFPSVKEKPFSTNNLTKTDSMLQECVELKSIDFSIFNFNRLESYNNMFDKCKELTNIIVRSSEDKDIISNICEKYDIHPEFVFK